MSCSRRRKVIAAALTAPVILQLSTIALARRAEPAGPTTAPSTVIDQNKIDAAIAKMQRKQTDRGTPATQPAAQNIPVDPADYPRELVNSRKVELLHQYDSDIAQARQALRHRELVAADVRDLIAEQTSLAQLPMDRFRDLLIEADARNARRTARYHEAFGDLEHAAATVVTILTKSGLIDSAQALPDDPLSEEIEESHGVRRVYFRFILPASDSTGGMLRHNGFIEFQLAQKQGLWLPTWSDLMGDPIPLFDLEAFAPLRPYHIVYDGSNFIVAQESPQNLAPPQIFSLLSVRNTDAYRRVGNRGFVQASER